MPLGRKRASLGLLNADSFLLFRVDSLHAQESQERFPTFLFQRLKVFWKRKVQSDVGSSLGPRIRVHGEHRGNLGEGEVLPIPAPAPPQPAPTHLNSV